MTPMRIVFALCARLKAEGSMAAAAKPVPRNVRRLISTGSSFDCSDDAPSVGDAREMTAGDVAEGHDRPERDARARIVAAHDAVPVVADRIEARQGRPVGA